MPNFLDDFLCEVQPEEFEEPMVMPEDIQDDNPIDDDFDSIESKLQWQYMNGDFPDEE